MPILPSSSQTPVVSKHVHVLASPVSLRARMRSSAPPRLFSAGSMHVSLPRPSIPQHHTPHLGKKRACGSESSLDLLSVCRSPPTCSVVQTTQGATPHQRGLVVLSLQLLRCIIRLFLKRRISAATGGRASYRHTRHALSSLTVYQPRPHHAKAGPGTFTRPPRRTAPAALVSGRRRGADHECRHPEQDGSPASSS